MTQVFIGGSRHLRRLAPEVEARLDRIVERGLAVLIGDAPGADRAVQAHLHARGHTPVAVFCAGTTCRNNLGAWPVRTIEAHGERGSAFFALKDRAMAEAASVGFMLWDGESKGTLLNVLRLLRLGKKVVVHLAPVNRFEALESPADGERLLSSCDPELQSRIEEQLEAEAQTSRRSPFRETRR